jgi:hypothetical protein
MQPNARMKTCWREIVTDLAFILVSSKEMVGTLDLTMYVHDYMCPPLYRGMYVHTYSDSDQYGYYLYVQYVHRMTLHLETRR